MKVKLNVFRTWVLAKSQARPNPRWRNLVSPIKRCGQLLQGQHILCQLSAIACLKVSADGFWHALSCVLFLSATTFEEVAKLLQHRSSTGVAHTLCRPFMKTSLIYNGIRQFFSRALNAHSFFGRSSSDPQLVSRSTLFQNDQHVVHPHQPHSGGSPSSPCVLLPLRPLHRPPPFPDWHGLLSSSALALHFKHGEWTLRFSIDAPSGCTLCRSVRIQALRSDTTDILNRYFDLEVKIL